MFQIQTLKQDTMLAVGKIMSLNTEKISDLIIFLAFWATKTTKQKTKRRLFIQIFIHRYTLLTEILMKETKLEVSEKRGCERRDISKLRRFQGGLGLSRFRDKEKNR